MHLKDGRELPTTVVDGVRFVLPVWSTRVDDSAAPVEYYVAYDRVGVEIARQPA